MNAGDVTPAGLVAALERARVQLAAPRLPDRDLETAVDETRARFGLPFRYVDETRELEAEHARLERETRKDIARDRAGLTWEHRHACPSCYAFRAISSSQCPRCGSLDRPIPAHERAGASAGTAARANRRRYEKRRRVQRGY